MVRRQRDWPGKHGHARERWGRGRRRGEHHAHGAADSARGHRQGTVLAGPWRWQAARRHQQQDRPDFAIRAGCARGRQPWWQGLSAGSSPPSTSLRGSCGDEMGEERVSVGFGWVSVQKGEDTCQNSQKIGNHAFETRVGCYQQAWWLAPHNDIQRSRCKLAGQRRRQGSEGCSPAGPRIADAGGRGGDGGAVGKHRGLGVQGRTQRLAAGADKLRDLPDALGCLGTRRCPARPARRHCGNGHALQGPQALGVTAQGAAKVLAGTKGGSLLQGCKSLTQIGEEAAGMTGRSFDERLQVGKESCSPGCTKSVRNCHVTCHQGRVACVIIGNL
eukprot:m.76346 g.76346  ORF g.76346 m.76346 type:complete len:331 (-) comp13170_c1_seq2:671-1663(-)